MEDNHLVTAFRSVVTIIESKEASEFGHVLLPIGMDNVIEIGGGKSLQCNHALLFLKLIGVDKPEKKFEVEDDDPKLYAMALAAALFNAAVELRTLGITVLEIRTAFRRCGCHGGVILLEMTVYPGIYEKDALAKDAAVAFGSEALKPHTDVLTQLSVDAVLSITDIENTDMLDLRNIKYVYALEGDLSDSELVLGLVFINGSGGINGPRIMENAKIAFVRLCIFLPENEKDGDIDFTDKEKTVTEERAYIIHIIKKMKEIGCNVVLFEGEASALALDCLDEANMLVGDDITERQVKGACSILKCRPIVSMEDLKVDNLIQADLVEKMEKESYNMLKVTGIRNPESVVTLVVRASNIELVDEAIQSMRVASYITACLVNRPTIIPAGGAFEAELSCSLDSRAEDFEVDSRCIRAYAKAVLTIPSNLAKKTGLDPSATVKELLSRHARGEKSAGIDVTTSSIRNMLEERKMQAWGISHFVLLIAQEAVLENI